MTVLEEKNKVAILRVLHDADGLLGSADISSEMAKYGIDLSDRTIRWYLLNMEHEGLVTGTRRGREGGRSITPAGVEELSNALVMERVGFTAAKVDTLAWQMTFDVRKMSGMIVLNTTLIDEKDLSRAIKVMVPVFESGFGMGDYLYLGHAGEILGHVAVPEGKVVIGTVCSVTINGILLKYGIPAVSKFGGVLEMDKGKPYRFTDVIYYEGSSLDPLEIFIKGKLTSVADASKTGHGRIGASFREVPTAALKEVEKIHKILKRAGLGGILMIGKPNQPLLDFHVHEGRTGIIVAGGLNPAAAVEESGIPTTNFALSCLFDFNLLLNYRDLAKKI